MGITLSSKNKSIDMGYAGFMRLRMKVAELTSADIFFHYKYLGNHSYMMTKEDFSEYNKKTNELRKKHNSEDFDWILSFLYAPDAEGIMNVEACKAIYEVVKYHDDDCLYGYSGRPDCAKFKDFKAILLDCIENESEMEWF